MSCRAEEDEPTSKRRKSAFLPLLSREYHDPPEEKQPNPHRKGRATILESHGAGGKKKLLLLITSGRERERP